MSTYKSPFVSVEEVLALKNGSGSGRGYSDKYRSVV